MAVSGEFRYFGPAFSSVARVRPVKAMTLAASLLIGNMTRFRNFEYIAEIAASGFGLPASGFGPPTSDLGELSSCFHENNPLSRRTSSLNSPLRRSRRRKPESGA